MDGRKILRCLIEGVLTGIAVGVIDSLGREAKAEIKRIQKRHAQKGPAVPFNSRFNLSDLN